MNNFLSIDDVTNLEALVASARNFKQNPYAKKQQGEGKTLGLLFMNPSLRTRLSTQRAAYNLGMNVMVINVNQDSWQLEFEDGSVMDGSSVEHVKDAAAVFSQYCDIIGIRTFAGLVDRLVDYQEKVLHAFVKYAQVPIVSLESATLHPLQSLADVITIEETKTRSKPKVVLSWAPHPKALPQAVANSFLQWVSETDCDLMIAHPEGYNLSSDFCSGAAICHNQEEAFIDADFIYAKNWSSYEQYGKVLCTDPAWTINQEKMSLTNNGQFMHCLPLRRNVVATDEVVDHSLVLVQAKNRLFAAQAVLDQLLSTL